MHTHDLDVHTRVNQRKKENNMRGVPSCVRDILKIFLGFQKLDFWISKTGFEKQDFDFVSQLVGQGTCKLGKGREMNRGVAGRLI